MNREEIKKIASTLENVSQDRPFKDDTLVLRHSDTKKWFALIMKIKGKSINIDRDFVEILNLKCEVELIRLLKEKYSNIIPAFHMNKEHWISVILDENKKVEELEELIKLSYNLTK